MAAIKWTLSDSSDLHLTRNVGGIFSLTNNGPEEIQLALPPGEPVNPANRIARGRTILVQVKRESDLVIKGASGTSGTFELLSPST